MNQSQEQKIEKATFAAGCFWGVQAAFDKVPGVIATAVGYMGGISKKPTYEDICTDTTGHAEVVEVTFNPQKISYEKLLHIFFSIHNPTTKNRQGADVGTQYRSAVFYYSDAQKKAVLAAKELLEKSGAFKKPIVTEIIPASEFWRAEEYHQKYLAKRGAPSCHL